MQAKKWMVSLSNNFGILTVLKIKKMFSNERTWSHYSTSGIIQDCRHQQASSTLSPPVRNEAKKEKKAGSSLTPPPLIAQSVLQHCRHRRAARSRLRDPSSCSSASSTRGCETESAPEMLADAPIGNRGARQWAALVLVGAPWCRWAHSGTSKLSGRVGRWVEIWWVEQPPGQEVTQTRSPGQHQQSWKICLEF